MTMPDRWRPLCSYFDVLLEPLVAVGTAGCFLVEANGPDGQTWKTLTSRTVDLASEEQPAHVATRAVARLCGATSLRPDPGPDGQRACGLYYVPSLLSVPKRDDSNAVALAAIVLDVDDRNHGGRAGVLAALARFPGPTCLVHSGGGVQAAYVLREAVVFDRRDEGALADSVRGYLRVALALESITNADSTWWPSHLFRCPRTFHLKDPSRPVLVEVEIWSDRRFNLSDFDDVAIATDVGDMERATENLVARLVGRPRRSACLERLPSLRTIKSLDGGPGRVVLPRRVSPAMVRLLNGGTHEKYVRPDGSLDRSRAVYAAALSLLQARVPPDEVAAMIAASALSAAIEARGEDGLRWLAFQVDAAKQYLAGRDSRCAR